MKAIVYDKYGPPEVARLEEIPTPEIGENQILVKVGASSVTTADWRMRASAFPGGLWLPGRLVAGVFRPRHAVLGTEFSGRIAAVGEKVTTFAVGDPVVGFSGHGSNAEYLVMPADGPIAPRPEGLDHRGAAALPFGAVSALVFLRDVAKLRAGQRILVVGASGGVGVYATQIARDMGAHVTGVASAENRDLVMDLGAEAFVDYRSQPLSALAERFDVIFDTVGALDFRAACGLLAPTGLFVPLNFGLADIVPALWSGLGKRPKMRISVNGDSRADLDRISDMIAAGALRPVIDRVFALDDIVEAHRHVEGRHRKGSVVVDVRRPGDRAADAA